MRLTITLNGSGETRSIGGSVPPSWQRQLVFTLNAEQADQGTRERPTDSGSPSVSFKTYFASFLKNSSYRELL
jgi:hypothetical protein